MRYLISLIIGMLLPLAFAPVNIYMLSIIAPAFLLHAWFTSSKKQAFWHGLLFGLGFFTVGSSWIYISVHNFGNATPLLAAFLTSLLILLMALYPAIQGFLLRQFWPNKSVSVMCLCLFPASWTLLEYIRSFLFDGFPFLFLGYAQMSSPLRSLAPLVGVYGLSFITTFISGLFVLMTQKQEPRRIKFIGIALILMIAALSFSVKHHNWTKKIGNPINLSLIQGNIPQALKWDSNQLSDILNTYERLTEAHWDSNLIIWPEAAIPVFPSQVHDFIKTLNAESSAHHDTLIIGAPLSNDLTQTYYNGLIMLGENSGSYRKRHLVPFGEFIPLHFLFAPLMDKLNVPMSDLTPGPQDQTPLFFDTLPMALFICYETAFPVETLREMTNKAFGINIVDDAWFGDSFAAPQQLQMTQARALETGRYIVITANTGITAVINPFGDIISQLPMNTEAVLTEKINGVSGKTPLMIYGYYPILLFFLLLLLLPNLRFFDSDSRKATPPPKV